MIRIETIIGVADIRKSSEWYQKLLGCKSNHGGNNFEILVDNDNTVILCLHKWGEHHHPTLANPAIKPGNGLILYIKVDDLAKIWANSQKLDAQIEALPQKNENSGKDEFAIRDLDGYYLLISLP